MVFPFSRELFPAAAAVATRLREEVFFFSGCAREVCVSVCVCVCVFLSHEFFSAATTVATVATRLCKRVYPSLHQRPVKTL